MSIAIFNDIRCHLRNAAVISTITLFSTNSIALDQGQYRVQTTWGANYLNSAAVNGDPVRVAPLNINWNSQKWNFEAVLGTNNEFRIRSEWPGNYLSCGGNDWADTSVALLNSDWYSQRWIVEPQGDNQYRLRCKWNNSGNAKYLHGSNIAWHNVRGAPLNTAWSSQVWKLHSLSDITPPIVTPPPTSSDAIVADFENHDNNTVYDINAQSKDWDVAWSSSDMNTYTQVSNQESYSGGKSLKVTYPDNAQIGVGTQLKLPEKTEYYLSYQLKFDANFGFNGEFDGSTGGKLPGLAASGLCSGGATCDGTNGFTSRYMWREDGRAVLYLYHMDKPGKFGEDIQLKSDGEDVYFPKGKWFNMTQRVRINDVDQSNGSIDVWLDKKKVLSLNNLRFVTNGQKIDTFYFNTFHGGSGPTWWPRYTTQAYFDDLIVSTLASDVGL